MMACRFEPLPDIRTATLNEDIIIRQKK